jgi:hypothetical protein
VARSCRSLSTDGNVIELSERPDLVRAAWLALTELGLTGEDLLAAFEPDHPASLTAKTAVANLRDKLSDDEFRHNLDPFVTDPPPGYDLDAAAELLIGTVLSKIPKPPA